MGRGFRWFDDISASFRGMGDLPGFSPTLGWSRHWVPSQKSSVDVTKMLVAHPPVVQPCNLPIGHNGNIYQISYPFWLFHLQDPEGSLLRWSHSLSRASKKYFDLDDPHGCGWNWGYFYVKKISTSTTNEFFEIFEILYPVLKSCEIFEILCPVLKSREIFEILYPVLKSCEIFEILYPVLKCREIFEILYPILKSCKIFEILHPFLKSREIFEILYPALKFCHIFEILYPFLKSCKNFEILYPFLKSCQIFEILYPFLKSCKE